MEAKLKCDPCRLRKPKLHEKKEGPKRQAPEQRHRTRENYGYTKAQAKVIYIMRRAGYTYKEISEQIGKSPNAIRKWAKARWGKEVEVDRYKDGQRHNADQGDGRDDGRPDR